MLWKFTFFLITNSYVLHNIFAVQKDDNDNNYDRLVWCKFQANGYDCTEDGFLKHKFYYDLKMEDCKTFAYGECPKSQNHFNTLSDCQENCKDVGLRKVKANVSAKAFCRYQPDFGDCNSYYPMFYFDLSQRICKGFSYSGCGGNLNRFENAQICSAICADVVEYL